MTARDIAAIGVPLLAGTTLLARSLRRALRATPLRRLGPRVADAHARWTARLARSGVLRIPGILLVDPSRSWIAAEAAALCAASFLAILSHTAWGMITAILGGAVVGFVTLWGSLRDAAGKQVGRVRRSLPTASFLLSLLLDAGMGSHASLQEVIAALPPGPLSRELEEIARARTLGIPRAEAFERSRGRVPLDDYQLFLNLVHQGEQLGVGLSHGLRELSSRMLEAQEHRAEALAQKAAVKLLFPLAAFIFPAVVLVILSPVILSLIDMWRR